MKKLNWFAIFASYEINFYFTYPKNPGAYPLVHSCRCLHPSLQIWCQLCRQYGFPISPKWGRHLVSPICPPPDITPPLVSCRPGGWGVRRVHSERGNLAEQGRGYCPAICCNVLLWVLRYRSWIPDVQRWNESSRCIFFC